jgi:hypothetical protein
VIGRWVKRRQVPLVIAALLAVEFRRVLGAEGGLVNTSVRA